MTRELKREEIALRVKNFCLKMDSKHPDWDTALIVSKVNQYYFTGTMQDGLLAIKRGGAVFYFVRRSFERASDESPLETIYPISGYKDAAIIIGADLGRAYVETEIMTVAILERLKKYFIISALGALDKAVLAVRAVKTAYEIGVLEEAGRRHNALMHTVVPALLREGMSEAELSTALFAKMMENGHHGVTRFQMFQTEMGVGQVGFGDSILYPTSFDGPGGNIGLSAAVPLFGSRERKLKKGDLVFVDIGYGFKGYHSDKSQVYIYGVKPSAEMVAAHTACLEIEKRIAALLLPGARPSDIYRSVMSGLDDAFKRNFMGYGDRQVKFLGHGIGLHVDEIPVIAEGFDDPLEENMVLAIEPKKGIRDVGLVGVEDTYIVGNCGGRCITGGGSDIIEVYEVSAG